MSSDSIRLVSAVDSVPLILPGTIVAPIQKKPGVTLVIEFDYRVEYVVFWDGEELASSIELCQS